MVGAGGAEDVMAGVVAAVVVVAVPVVVSVALDVEAAVALAGDHRARDCFPASPVAMVCSSGPGFPLTE